MSCTPARPQPSDTDRTTTDPCTIQRGAPRRTSLATALLAALAFGGAGGLLVATPALSQTRMTASQPGTSTTYSIPAGNLRTALDGLAARTNVQVAYSPQLVRGLTTHGVSGRYTPKAALHQLLRGTGLTSKETGASTFVLVRASDPPPADPPAQAQTNQKTTSTAPPPQTLNPVIVTGSLINNAQIQTATPTYTITAQDIQNNAFSNVANVLENSMFNLGNVQGQAHSGSFTEGARTYKLFGLQPGYTLLLIDGKPVTNFGELYNGDDAFNNVSGIPLGIVSRIDIMPGGASSIYGSSAIAGVINIVTKQHFNGMQLSARVGSFTKGGGDNERVRAVFGHDFGKWNFLGAAGVLYRAPIWNFQRSMTRGTDAQPNGVLTPTEVAYIHDYGPAADFNGHFHGYLSPPDGCSAMAGLFGGTTFETIDVGDPKRTGTYCGSYKVDAMRTLSPRRRNYDLMLKVKYYPNDNLRLYTDFMGGYQREQYVSGTSHWETEDFPGGGVEDATTTDILHIERHFAPEEMPGGYSSPLREYRENNLRYRIDVGANGNFGQNWSWNAYFMHDSDRNRAVKPLFLASAVDQFFENYILGPQVGYDAANGFNTYNINYQHEFTPLTPSEWASFVRPFAIPSKTWINQTRATLSNTDLFSLPGGGVGFAALLEFGNMAWYEPTNPFYASGQVFGHSQSSGGGRRQHKAAAFELNLPVFKQLTFDLSGRFDKYKNAVVSNDKFTYKIGIEFRPIDTLLFRANYATAFQAPQMPALFLGPSHSFDTITDYYACDLAHAADCSADQFNYEVEVAHGGGNPSIRPTTAKTWTGGVVWAPTSSLSFHADYLHVAIQDEVILQDTDHLLKEEAQCRLGTLDPNSPLCAQTLGQIQRNQFGVVTGLTRYYANLSNETVDSLTTGMQYSFDTSRLGKFKLRLNYNDLLKHTFQELPGSPVIDTLRDPENEEGIKTVVEGSLTWQPNQQWSTTLYYHRTGSFPNDEARDHGYAHKGSANLPAWIRYNWSLHYRPRSIPSLSLSLEVRNLLNKLPPIDVTYTGYPYYYDEVYNVLGREIMLGARWKFGG